MLHIVFFILKLILLLILAVLAVILAVFLSVLLAPVRYQGEMSLHERFSAERFPGCFIFLPAPFPGGKRELRHISSFCGSTPFRKNRAQRQRRAKVPWKNWQMRTW